MLTARLRTVAVVAILVGASLACGAALLLPTSAFDTVLADFIGQPGHAATTSWQRLLAVAGAGLGAISLASIAWGLKDRTLPAPPRRGVLVTVLGGLLALNALTVAHRLGALRHLRLPRASYTILPVIIVLGCAWFLARGARGRELRAGDVGLWAPAAAGAGYGCFSGLWHCCAPPWVYADGTTPLWFGTLALALGAVGRAAASLRFGFGEILGAVVFGVTYPWHTPAFFVQSLLGGAFATALVRVTGSGWAPTAFLGAAYLTHTTLPFLGPIGLAIGAALLVACAALARHHRRAVTAATTALL